MDLTFIQNNLWLVGGLVVWEFIWKGLALWVAARNEERYWFIALLVINTVGILPIAYLLMHYQKNRQPRLRLHI